MSILDFTSGLFRDHARDGGVDLDISGVVWGGAVE
jgi:hypothetical protein